MSATEYDQPLVRRLWDYFCIGRRIILTGTLFVGPAAWAGDAVGGIVEEPLAPRSGPPGATMFTELAPAQTGIITENRYADPRMWGERYPQFAFGSTGTGVAIR